MEYGIKKSIKGQRGKGQWRYFDGKIKNENKNENLSMKNQVVIKPAAATELWREFQLPVLFHFLSPGHWIMDKGIYNK